MYKAKQSTLEAQRALASINYSRQQKAQEAVDLQDGIKLVADFYSELTKHHSLLNSLQNNQKVRRSAL
ncbi:hypothetical protein [Pantoea anthophila]|uniref:hypothetical protein n=1 Tax=Pantoea anthophila TaxID=470931 RepID=UPI0027876D08|nr:hypothetical protein [Pantoea anthophila]MDQ1214821.1 hypothetical protein [Pantoea anthophila]